VWSLTGASLLFEACQGGLPAPGQFDFWSCRPNLVDEAQGSSGDGSS
jgi:hypothetical protein